MPPVWPISSAGTMRSKRRKAEKPGNTTVLHRWRTAFCKTNGATRSGAGYLVLGHIDDDFRNQIFVGKLVARSTRFTSFCTSPVVKLHPISVEMASIFARLVAMFAGFAD